MAKYGKCQDPLCDEPDEPTDLLKYGGLWRCDGCQEAYIDNEDFLAANAAEIVGRYFSKKLEV